MANKEKFYYYFLEGIHHASNILYCEEEMEFLKEVIKD